MKRAIVASELNIGIKKVTVQIYDVITAVIIMNRAAAVLAIPDIRQPVHSFRALCLFHQISLQLFAISRTACSDFKRLINQVLMCANNVEQIFKTPNIVC